MARKVDIEKRKHPRAKHVLTIYHRLHKRKGQLYKKEWECSLTENMSAGGVLFGSSVVYQLKDVLDLKIIMGGALHIYEGLGQVIRIEPKKVIKIYKTAIHFSRLNRKPRRQ